MAKNDNTGLFLGLGLLGAGLFLFSSSKAAAAPPVQIDFSKLTPTEFIKLLYPYALQSEKETGVPALVTLAQAIIESGWGKSNLAMQGNNFFGIKRKDWTGNVIFLDTWECGKHGNALQDGITDQIIKIFPPGDANGNAACNKYGFYSYRVNAAFRAYNSPADSFADHGKVLRNNDRYSKAFAYTSDAKQFAREIAAAGYATSPTYAAALIQLIDKIQLLLT